MKTTPKTKNGCVEKRDVSYVFSTNNVLPPTRLRRSNSHSSVSKSAGSRPRLAYINIRDRKKHRIHATRQRCLCSTHTEYAVTSNGAETGIDGRFSGWEIHTHADLCFVQVAAWQSVYGPDRRSISSNQKRFRVAFESQSHPIARCSFHPDTVPRHETEDFDTSSNSDPAAIALKRIDIHAAKR